MGVVHFDDMDKPNPNYIYKKCYRCDNDVNFNTVYT